MALRSNSKLKRWRGAAIALLLASSVLQAQEPGPRVRVATSMGEFVIELDPQRAPVTVENFLRYVREGFYDGTLFHRVVPNFVIQGGGYAAAGNQLKPTHPPVFNEAGNGLTNFRGTVGMARAGSAHTANSQFYVNLADNPELNPLPSRWGYAVFGRVVQGMEVVDRIGVVPTGSVGPFKSDAPLKPVIIEKVELLGGSVPTSDSTTGQPAAASPAANH